MTKQHNTFTAAEIADACSGRVEAGPGDAMACGISTDTRQIEPGQAFFALVGDRHDAHDFVPQALEHGASVVIADRYKEEWPVKGDASVVVVDDTTAALGALASWHRDRLNAVVIAVTGSCGKSTVKNMSAKIVGRHGSCTFAPKSFNNAIGVPLTLLSATMEDDFVVLELGANAPGEIDELAALARPDIGIITCIGECHLEGFGDLYGVRDAKAELTRHVSEDGVLILNADDRLCLSTGKGYGGRIVTFGFSNEASVRPVAVRRREDTWQFHALDCQFSLPLPGRYNVRNAAAALAVGREAGVDPHVAAEALGQFSLPPLRFRRRQMGGVTFIEDCYNSNPTAVRAAVDTFTEESVSGRRVMIFGDMLELGEEASRLHQRTGRYLAGEDIQMLVAIGDHGRDLLRGWNRAASASRQAMRFKTAEEAWESIWKELKPGDCVLIKGSRATGLETITDRIEQHLQQTEVAA